MNAHLVIAASLCAIALPSGCGGGGSPRRPSGPPGACSAKIPATASHQERALLLAKAALDRLVDGNQREGIACAMGALQHARALPRARLPLYDRGRQKLVGTIEFVAWMAEYWNLGGPYDVEVPKHWDRDRKREFEKIAKLSEPAFGGNRELERAVGAAMIGLTAMAHFDPANNLGKYNGLLEYGRTLIEPWKKEPAEGFHYQAWILFHATVEAWPHVRVAAMDKVPPCCDPLKSVQKWDPELQENAERAKTACGVWLGAQSSDGDRN
ncbi:MAG TPA: hypothetical protein VNO30_24045 [Kofleriaceae bacterium]|nr:hypothetical protein [Kofleriaceae bacterium]